MPKGRYVIDPQALMHPDVRVTVSLYEGVNAGFFFANASMGDSKVSEIECVGQVKPCKQQSGQ